jgi:CrcB protein
MIAYLWVFIGGGLGSICRFGVSQMVESSNSSFPWATLVANATSCIILGYLMGIMLKAPPSTMWRLLLTTGFCGGFSTFSTFSAETLLLFQTGQHVNALLNIAGSLVIGLIGIFIGLKIAV